LNGEIKLKKKYRQVSEFSEKEPAQTGADGEYDVYDDRIALRESFHRMVVLDKKKKVSLFSKLKKK
jgi:hypothetical protein